MCQVYNYNEDTLKISHVRVIGNFLLPRKLYPNINDLTKHIKELKEMN